MEELIVGLLKQSPIVGFLLGLAFIAMRWLERTQDRCHKQHDEVVQRYHALAEKTLQSANAAYEATLELLKERER